MKTHFLLFVTIFVLFFTACSQEEIFEEETNTQVVMYASNFEFEVSSKTNIQIDDSGGVFSWSENDTVGVFPNEGGQVFFPMISGKGTNMASFNGGGWALKPSSTYTAYYPFIGNIYLDKTKIPVNYEGQIQIGNASTAHLGKFDYMVAKASTPENGHVQFNFKHLGALVELSVPTKLSSVDYLDFITDNPLFISKGTVDLCSESSTVTGVNQSSSFRVTLKDIKQLSKDNPLKVYLFLSPADFTNNLVLLKVSNRQGAFEELHVPLKVLEAGKAYRISALQEEQSKPENSPMILSVRANITNDFTVELPLIGTYGGHWSDIPTGLDCEIDWGDGSVEHYVNLWPISHQYSTIVPTSYEIKISGKVYGLSSMEIQKNSITEVKEWGNLGLKSMFGAFKGNDVLVKVADDTEGAFKEVGSFGYAFSDCQALKEVPADLFAYAAKVTDFEEVFHNCLSLKTLPAGLFDHCISATTFERAFYYCRNFEVLPDYLFQGCSKVWNFDTAFCWCDKLVTLPENLFKNCMSVTTFYSAFQSCCALESIPSGLFKDCSQVTNFQYVFGNCHSLKVVPLHLFDSCKEVTNFINSFYSCEKLETIPEGLFSNCSKVTSFKEVFRSDVSLKEIPSRLFEGCTSVNSFHSAFGGCKEIKVIPKDLFQNCVEATDFGYVFSGCSSLGAIPNGLFEKNAKVVNFGGVFNGCSSLTSVPCNLFDRNVRTNDFSNAFRNCINLSGESPYTVIDGVKYHLYEREKNPDYFIKPGGYSCFSGCSLLSDYGVIPQGWKK